MIDHEISSTLSTVSLPMAEIASNRCRVKRVPVSPNSARISVRKTSVSQCHDSCWTGRQRILSRRTWLRRRRLLYLRRMSWCVLFRHQVHVGFHRCVLFSLRQNSIKQRVHNNDEEQLTLGMCCSCTSSIEPSDIVNDLKIVYKFK